MSWVTLKLCRQSALWCWIILPETTEYIPWLVAFNLRYNRLYVLQSNIKLVNLLVCLGQNCLKGSICLQYIFNKIFKDCSISLWAWYTDRDRNLTSWNVQVSWLYINSVRFLCSPKGERYSRRFVHSSEPAFETYGLLFCTKTVAKPIIGVRVWVILGLC